MDKKKYFYLGLALYLFTAFWNIGIIALDDYSDIVSQIIPAQKHTFTELINNAGIRTPVPSVLLLSITKLAFSVGITNPVFQLRVALMLFALFSFLTLNFCTQNIFSTEDKKKNSLFLVSFYFLAPLFLTRLMIESLSAPWLLLSGLFATRYYNNKKIMPLFLSVLFLSIASIFRFQAGSCLLALPVLILFNKKYSHFIYLIIFGALFFILTGLIDQFIYGQFHRSLLSYIQ